MTEHPKADPSPLELRVAIKDTTVKLGEPIRLEIMLTNKSHAPVVVNARFSMGYPDTLDRDLYCEVFREDGGSYRDYEAFQVDYRSVDLTPALFPSLQPGETLQVTYDLQEWYPLTAPGQYTVRVVYEPTPFPGAANAVSGRVASALITINVVP